MCGIETLGISFLLQPKRVRLFAKWLHLPIPSLPILRQAESFYLRGTGAVRRELT